MRPIWLLLASLLVCACQAPCPPPPAPHRLGETVTPPIKAVGFPGVDGGGFATLPAAGAYEAAPTNSATAGVAAPVGVGTNDWLGWTATILYTQGASSGQMACKVYVYDGANWGQVASPVDQSYNGISLGVGTGQYTISGTVPRGATRLMLASAEIGVTGTPGSYTSEIAFQ